MRRSVGSVGSVVLAVAAACAATGGREPVGRASGQGGGDALPPGCAEGCTTPFGTRLGGHAGVEAYSNCSAACIDPTPVHVDVALEDGRSAADTYTGIRWQCVEYARRYWARRLGVVFGSVDTADDMWRTVQRVTALGTDATRLVERFDNGGPVPPQVADLIIYRKDAAQPHLGFGHVAVVVAVDDAAGWLRIAEQNYTNSPWINPSQFARELPLLEGSGRFTLCDETSGTTGPSAIYGWLRVGQAPGVTSRQAASRIR